MNSGPPADPLSQGAGEDLAQRLARRIAAEGPITVAEYMAEANGHYYASRDPFGMSGDFITAPEISQMFGELVGAWFGDLWLRAGKPRNSHYVELGPGRGTLAADALRALRGAGLAPSIEFIETSPTLRQAQARRVPAARWHDDLTTLPEEGPLLVVANEFFDALPVRQLGENWRELRVDFRDGRFVRDAATQITESSPIAVEIVGKLAGRIARQGGAALIIDYGYDAPGAGDTLQAVSRHRYVDPWEAAGTRDLTAHVDFCALAEAARGQGVRASGPVPQGGWLEAMGIDLRADALTQASPDRSEEFASARERLTAPSQMGRLFKVLALAAPDWPEPAGF